MLYLEGAGDRGILNGWCRRLLPAHAVSLSRSSVILGGKRPARAVEHFRSLVANSFKSKSRHHDVGTR